MSRRALLVAVFFILLNGCKETEKAAEVAGGAIPKAQAAAAAATARNAEEIGIAECDTYFAKYEACLRDKVPAEQRAQTEMLLQQQRKAWSDMAKDDANHALLAETCKQATTLATSVTSAYGCSW